MAKAYEDIGKDGSDLLARGFPNSGTFKVVAESKTPNGVTVTSTGSRSFAANKSGGLDEKLAGIVEPKYEIKEHDIEITGKLSTAGEYEAGISFKDLATKGTKLSFTGVQTDSSAIKASAAYKNDLVSTKASINFPFKTKTVINYGGEVVVRYPENVYLGVDLKYEKAVPGENVPQAEQPKDAFYWNAKAGFVAEGQQLTFSFDNALNREDKTKKDAPRVAIFNVGYYRAITSALKFAFGYSVEKQNAKGNEFHTGAEYKVDKDTILKGKFSFIGAPGIAGTSNLPDNNNREFRVALGVKQNLSERVNITVGADINARALLGTVAPNTLGTTKPHSFGFEVKFQ